MSDALEYAKNGLAAEEEKPGTVSRGLLILARAVVRQDEEIAALKENRPLDLPEEE